MAGVQEYTRPAEFFPIESMLISEFFNQHETILDIGCGAGRTTVSLTRAGYRVQAVDLSKKLLDAARAACPDVEFRQADVRKLPFPNNYFCQALFSFNGLDQLHPIDDYLEALIEVRRVKPGGIFIYSGHNILGRFGRHLKSLREFLAVSLRVHPRFLRLHCMVHNRWSGIGGMPNPLVNSSHSPPLHLFTNHCIRRQDLRRLLSGLAMKNRCDG